VSSRIVFVTWGSFGDLHPYLALARELQRRGHRTAIEAEHGTATACDAIERVLATTAPACRS
jgi:hypothetical protein